MMIRAKKILSNKIVWTFLLIMFGINISISQNNLRYNGKYTIKDSIAGEANYNYYKIGDSIIFNGNYRFKSDLYQIAGNGKLGQIAINGFYDNGKKKERWLFEVGEYSVNYNGIQDLRLITSLDGIERKIICRYNNGVPEGEWEIYRNSILNGRRQGQAISSKAIFKNGIINGPFSFEDRDGENYIIVNGSFNHEGYFHKIWNIKYRYDGRNYEETRVYRQGFLVKIQVIDKDSNQMLYDIALDDVDNKVTQLRNNEKDLDFEEGDKSFGLLFNNGYSNDNERIKSQLIGNEILETVFKRYSDKESIIGIVNGAVSPIINFTKRFKFIYPEKENLILDVLKTKVENSINIYDSLLNNNKFVLNKQKTDSLSFSYAYLEQTNKKLNILDTIILKLTDGSFDYFNRKNYFKQGVPELYAKDTIKYIYESKPRFKLIDLKLSIDSPESLVENLSKYYFNIDSISTIILNYTFQQIKYISEEKELENIDDKIVSKSNSVDSLYRFKSNFENVKQKDLNFKSNGRSEAEMIIPEIYVLYGMQKREELIERYSKEPEFQKKEIIGNQIIKMLEVLVEIYPDLQKISSMKTTIDSAYTRYSPNPFMDRLAESRIRPHIYSKGMERLLPYLLEELKKSETPEDLKRKSNDILRFRTNMIAFAKSDDEEIDKLNTRMRKENVPERIKRLLGLISMNNL